MNIANLLEKSARKYPALPALARGSHPYCNYQTLSHRAGSIAHHLRHTLRCQPGDRIGIILKNCPEYMEILFGILHAGLAAVPINAKLHPEEWAYILDNSGTRHVFSSGDKPRGSTQSTVTADPTASFSTQLAPLPDRIATLESIIDIDSAHYRQLRDGPALPLQDAAPDDLAWLFYTSGTTGKPKGAMLSHRNLFTMTLSYFVGVDSIAADHTLLHAAPMSHGSGLYAFPFVAVAAQQAVCSSASFDPQEIFELLQHYPNVSMFAAPTMIKRMVDTQSATSGGIANLHTIIYGGGPMYVADIKAAMARFGNKFAQIYGQGESPMTITSLPKRDHYGASGPASDAILASVGTAQAAVQVRIADGQGNSLPPGEVGEILVKGDTIMLGYWQNPEATASAIVGGWLCTGDMGTFDEQGYLTLKDRSKDLIISGGTNIYPREVEEVLLQHPAVAEASVIGRPHPEWGEETIAFIVCKQPVEPQDRAALTSSLDQFCLDHMARFKRPKDYHLVAELPKNNYGKVLKTELRKQLN